MRPCHMCRFCRHILVIHFNESNNKIVINVVAKWEFGILSKSDTNYSGWRPTHSGKSEMTHQSWVDLFKEIPNAKE